MVARLLARLPDFIFQPIKIISNFKKPDLGGDPNDGEIKMDLMDSKNVNNRIKKRSVVIAVIAHLYFAFFTLGISLILLLLAGFNRHSA